MPGVTSWKVPTGFTEKYPLQCYRSPKQSARTSHLRSWWPRRASGTPTGLTFPAVATHRSAPPCSHLKTQRNLLACIWRDGMYTDTSTLIFFSYTSHKTCDSFVLMSAMNKSSHVQVFSTELLNNSYTHTFKMMKGWCNCLSFLLSQSWPAEGTVVPVLKLSWLMRKKMFTAGVSVALSQWVRLLPPWGPGLVSDMCTCTAWGHLCQFAVR